MPCCRCRLKFNGTAHSSHICLLVLRISSLIRLSVHSAGREEVSPTGSRGPRRMLAFARLRVHR